MGNCNETCFNELVHGDLDDAISNQSSINIALQFDEVKKHIEKFRLTQPIFQGIIDDETEALDKAAQKDDYCKYIRII